MRRRRGHAGTHHFVVVEGDTPRREGAGAGLADVVEQGGETQQPVRARLVHHGQRVGQDVLVAMDGVLLEGEPGKLGEELGGQTGLDDEPQTRRGLVHRHQLVELVADPLGRHDRQPVVHGRHRGGDLGNGLEPEAGQKARRAQHPQRVVAEGDLGGERRAQAARREVGEPVVGVHQLEVGEPQGHGVDGEVTARQVHLDGVAERHLGLARFGPVDLGAMRRDLKALPLVAEPDRPEALPLQPHRIGPPPHEALDLVGSGVGREVEILLAVTRIGPGEGVAHRSAHDVEAATGFVEATRQLGGGLDQGLETLGDHRRRG